MRRLKRSTRDDESLRLAAIDRERMSYGIGSGVASVVVKPETADERLDRLVEEAAEAKR